MSGLNRKFRKNKNVSYQITNKIILDILTKIYLNQKKSLNNEDNTFLLTLKEMIDNKTINVKNIFVVIVALENSITNYDFLLDINKTEFTPIPTDKYLKKTSGSSLAIHDISVQDLEMNTLYQYLLKYFSIQSIDMGYICTNKKTGIKSLNINDSEMHVAGCGVHDKKFMQYAKNWLEGIKDGEFNFMISEAENIIEINEITPSNVLHLLRTLHYNINVKSTYKDMTKEAIYGCDTQIINKCLKIQLEHEYMYKVLSNNFTWEITYNGDKVDAIIEYKNKEVA